MKLKPGYVYLLINDDEESWSYSIVDKVRILLNTHDNEDIYNIDGTKISKYTLWKKTIWGDLDEVNDWVNTGLRLGGQIKFIKEYSIKEYKKLNIDKELTKIKMMENLQR